MEINGGQVLICVNGEAIGCTTDATLSTATLNLEPYDRPPILCPSVPEWNLTVSGKWPELTRLQALEFEWYCSVKMPRKKKKAYRKKLSHAIAYELYREKVDRFLSKIGPENE